MLHQRDQPPAAKQSPKALLFKFSCGFSTEFPLRGEIIERKSVKKAEAKKGARNKIDKFL